MQKAAEHNCAFWRPPSPFLKLKTRAGELLLNKDLDEAQLLQEYNVLLLGLDGDPFPLATLRDLRPGLHIKFQGQVFKIQ